MTAPLRSLLVGAAVCLASVGEYPAPDVKLTQRCRTWSQKLGEHFLGITVFSQCNPTSVNLFSSSPSPPYLSLVEDAREGLKPDFSVSSLLNRL